MFLGAELLGTDRAAAVAALADASSSTSRRSGASPTTGSGRRAGRGGTTRTPRSWPGWCSTAPCGWPSGSSSRRPWSAGSRSATRSTRRSASSGYDPERRTFTQYYGSKELDASVLNIPLVGLPARARDERVTGTIDAISRELGRDGFVSRYSTAETDDGLPGDEGQFLACSFWLVSALALNGRVDEARALFERLLGLANDLGLLAEEYDVDAARQVGNFPQAFSHLTLILAARAIAAAEAADGSVSAPAASTNGRTVMLPRLAQSGSAAGSGFDLLEVLDDLPAILVEDPLADQPNAVPKMRPRAFGLN